MIYIITIIITLFVIVFLPDRRKAEAADKMYRKNHQHLKPDEVPKIELSCPVDKDQITVFIEPISFPFPIKNGTSITLITRDVTDIKDFYWDVQTDELGDICIYPEPGYDYVDVYLENQLIGNSHEGLFEDET